MSVNKNQADQVRHHLEQGATLDEALARMATDDVNSKQKSVYHCIVSEAQDVILDELRSRIAKVAGVTLTGNRLTVRWNQHNREKHVQVHCVILEVS